MILLSLGSSGYFSFPESELLRLKQSFPSEEVKSIDPERLPEEIQSARAVLLWQFPKEALSRAERLQFIMYAADGLGPKRLYPELIASSVQVTNSRGVRAQAMAEHAIGSLLGLSRRLFEARDAQQRKQWLKKELIEAPLPGSLCGQTLLLLGVGEIGSRIAKIASAGLGMRVIGVRANPHLFCPHIEEMFSPDDLSRALPQANAVILSLPPTQKTLGVLGHAELALLPKGSFVLNIGRGSSLDEPALADAVRSGHVRGAALDVFAEEPLSPESVLWSLPQVLITPHSAGVTPSLWPAINQIFMANLRRAESGEPLKNLVDKERGY